MDFSSEQSEQELDAHFDRFFRSRVEAMFQKLLWGPKICGDPNRLHISPEACIQDALLNVNSGHITIGEGTFFAFGVALNAGTHDPNKRMGERMRYPTEGCDIVIGRGVWIASRVTVLGPCRIGDNAVIGAGAVVLPGTDIPPNTLFAGVPAVFRRYV